MKKKVITLLTGTLLTASLIPANTAVFAKNAEFTTSTKNTSAIAVKKVDYDLDINDKSIDIDFSNRIQLKSTAKVTVKDQSDKKYSTYIEDKDSDEIDLNVAKLAAGKKYTVTITGIRKSGASKYGTLTIKFSIPKAKNTIVKEVDYDAEDREVNFEFNTNVTYKKPKVTITDVNGSKTYTAKIIERDYDELTVRVSGLTYGKKYKYTISGVSSSQNSSAKTYSGTFTAID